jgi:predicted permease
MMLIARSIIRLSALLAPSADRPRFKEEWLAELDAVSTRGRRSALRFAFGAPSDALARRSAAREPRRLFSAIGGDLKYTWRQLVGRPSHTLAVVACLVAGLFVSIGTFSAVESMMTGDKPGVHGRKQLMRLRLNFESAIPPETVVRSRRYGVFTTGEGALLAAEHLPPSSALTAVGLEGVMPMSLTGNHGPVAGTGAFVSGDYFKVLGTERGSLGLLLDRSHDVPGSTVAVVGDHFWRTQLDARPDAIGQSILVSGMSFTVIGVAPPRFHGMQADDVGNDDSRGAQIWIPLSLASRWPTPVEADDPWLIALARLKPGRTAQEGEAELALASRRIADTFPQQRGKATLLVQPENVPADVTPVQMASVFAALMLMPLTILAIGCANVANLQLARAAERSRELALRLSLGASRGQLIRLLTFETLARAFVAVALAFGLVEITMRYVQPFFPVFLSIDWGAATFSVSLALVVAMGTGLMPAWMVLRKTSAGQLKQSSQSGGLGHSRMRSGLIVAQVALSLCLLAATALVNGAVQRMKTAAPPALQQQVVASFNTAAIGMTPEEGRRFADRLVERASNDRRVSSIALSETNSALFGVPAEGGVGAERMEPTALAGISSSWLEVMDVKVLTGRALNDQDDDRSVVLSAHAADIASPSGAALGMSLSLQVGPATTRQVRVVGIVADTPTQPMTARPKPVVYTVLPKAFPREFEFRARTTSVDAVSADLLKLIPEVDSRVSWTSLRRGDMRFEDEAKFVSLLAMAIGACGTIALILSGTGLFAVMSYIVMLRRREIGVRLAIGAAPSQIVALVMRHGIKLVSIGAAIGLGVAIPVAFYMRAELEGGINPADPMVFGPALGLLFAVGVFAAALPSLRASRVDPIATLRQD